MKEKTVSPTTLENVQFDEFGRYEVPSIVADEELDLVAGGMTIIGQINIGYCPPGTPPTPPTPPKPNRTCGEDGDDDYEQD
ncbi:hypothetical protein ACFPU0_24675 [Pseudomonas sp. GCM10022186]|uniref:hypothetical protein n=1 Tax=Pseudomonas sp. GCM10022186 TaxID=3252650 RepID=UPI003621F205